jgi:hypothetical protein
MKKIFILLMAFGFFIAACNNNKTAKNQNSNNREKDDYGKSENRDNIDEKKNEENTMNKADDNNANSMVSGWPQVERDAFISNCVRTAMGNGKSRSVSQNYCDCMLNKMETLYPDIQEAAKLTDEELNSPAMEKMAKDCLRDN